MKIEKPGARMMEINGGKNAVRRIGRHRFKPRLMVSAVMMPVLALSVLLPGSWPQFRVRAVTCTISQITDGATENTGSEVSIDAAGNRVAFQSSADLTGSNPDNSVELFLFDAGLNTLTQITNGFGGIGLSPSISGNGDRIAFVSNDNLTGNNGDGNTELFLFEISSNTLTQITESIVGGSFSSSISADGNRIAFGSFSDLTGNNSDANSEVFLFDISANTLTQITDTQAGGLGGHISLSGDGSRLAFTAISNITGSNPDGNMEVLFADIPTNTITQITNTVGFINLGASISGDGTRVTFSSSGNPTGDNADGNREVFLFDVAANTVDQITKTTGGDGFANGYPWLSANGTRIAFSSSRNLTGNNSDGNLEVFVFDLLSQSFTQISDGTGLSGIAFVAIDASGSHIAFKSFEDLTGNNPDNKFQLFLASCVQIPSESSDLWTHLLDFPDPVRPGSEISYEIIVGNNGPNPAAESLWTIHVPQHTTFASLTRVSGWSCSTPERGGTGIISCAGGELGPGATARFTLAVTVDRSTPAGTTINNTARIGSRSQDSNPDNNVAAAVTKVFSR